MMGKTLKKPPCTFEEYTAIQAELSASRGQMSVLNEFGIDNKIWNEYNRYWGAKIKADMKLQRKMENIVQKIPGKNA